METNKENELVPIKTLEYELETELSKQAELQPLFPISESDVMKIEASEQNKAILLAAHNYPRVHQYPQLALRFKLLIAINKTIMFVGFNVQDLDFVYRGVFEYINEYAKHLTIEEIEIAFKKGRMDEYGEWHGLSAMTFCKWIRSYVNSTKGQAMQEKQKIKKMKEREAEPTLEEKAENRVQWLNYVLDVYEKYLETDEEYMDYEDYINQFYNLLYRLKLLDYSEKQRESFKRKARIMLRKDSRREVDVDMIVIRAKQLAVKDWLKNAKKNKVQLRAVMKQNNAEEFLRKTL